MIINGIDENEFRKGWWGEHGEGKELLRSLNLPADTIPIDIKEYLSNGKSEIRIRDINVVLTYQRHDDWFEFTITRKVKPKIVKLYREWNGEDLKMIIQLESYAVGEYTRLMFLSREY